MTRSRHRTLLTVIAIVASAVLGWWLWKHLQAKPAEAPAALKVTTITVQQQTMPRLIESSGRVLASQSAEIRAQASGVLETVAVREGDRVEKNALLFTVDSRPLRAALMQAKANLARDVALAEDAAQTEARLKPLASEEFVSAQDYQNALNTVHSLKATAAASRALVDEAALSLAYAEVRAPFAGRAGAVLVKPGNLVSPSSSTPLLLLNAASPADVAFSLPQQQAGALREARRGEGVATYALDPGTGKELARGKLTFVDNAFDEASGTLAAKARFDNADERLWPNEFVTVRLLLGEDQNALTVPESALQQGQKGAYVYVVREGKAAVQAIEVLRQQDGLAVIGRGLNAGDTIVTAVPNNLREGVAVEPVPAEYAAADSQQKDAAP